MYIYLQPVGKCVFGLSSFSWVVAHKYREELELKIDIAKKYKHKQDASLFRKDICANMEARACSSVIFTF